MEGRSASGTTRLRFALRAAAAGGALALAAVAFAVWGVRTVYLSGDLRIEGGDIRLRRVVWEPPRSLRTAETEAAPGPVEVLALPSPRGDLDLYECRLIPEGRSRPKLLAGAESWLTPQDELDPALDPRGHLLVFARKSPGRDDLDLWVSLRSGEGWGPPRRLGREVNSPYDERSPTLARSPAGGGERVLLAFATNRPRGFLKTPPSEWIAVAVEGRPPGDWNLAWTHAVPAAEGRLKWEAARELQGMNTGGDEIDPALAPDASALFFASNRPGGAGGFDLYRSRLLSRAALIEPGALGAWMPPENLGAPLNSPADEIRPRAAEGPLALRWVRRTPDGRAVELASRSVEVDRSLEIASLPLEVISRHAADLALLAASALALVFLTWLAWRTREQWAMSLTARCAAAAVLLHLLLLYAFYFWQVGREVLASAEREREVEIVSLEESLAGSLSVEVNRQFPQGVDPGPASPERFAERVEPQEPVPPVPETQNEPLPPLRPDQASGPRSGLPLPGSLPDLSPPSPVELAREAERAEPQTPRLPAPAPPRDVGEKAPGPEAVVEAPRDLEIPPDPLPQAAEAAGSAAAAEEPVLAAAKTPLRALELSPVLPAPAEARPDRAVPVTPLPVPAQAPEESAQEPSLESSLAGEPRAPHADFARSEAELEALAARIPQPESLWDAVPAGLEPATSAAEAEALPEVPLPAPSRLPRPAGARARAEAVLPVAERSAAAPRVEEAARDESPRLATLESPIPLGEWRPAAPVEAPLPAVETSPEGRSAAREPVPAAAVLAALESTPTPGPLAGGPPEAREKHESPAPLPEPSPQRNLADLAGAGAEAPSAAAPPAERLIETAFRDAPVPPPPAGAERIPAGPEVAALPRVSPGDPLGRAGELDTAPPEAPDPGRLEPAGASLPEAERPAVDPRDLKTARSPQSRAFLLETMGGTRESEDAVRRALDWLARHQSPDGSWDAVAFDRGCGECGGHGRDPSIDAALTGLATLAFLAHNELPKSSARYGRVVGRALDWLLAGQDASGNLARDDRRFTMYSHAIALLALSEAAILTGEARYRRALAPATALIVRAQNPITGGWRYLPVPPHRGDTSVTGWQVMALRSVAQAGVEVPAAVFEKARRWFDEEVAGGIHGGIYGYRRPSEPRVAMTAEGLFARQLLGGRRGMRSLDEAARYIHTQTRSGGHLDNLYLLYYGTMALYQYQGWIWESWNEQVRDFLVAKQHREGPAAGSWDPHGPWLEEGGRVLATAFAALTLEVYYRYLPLYWEPGRSGAR